MNAFETARNAKSIRNAANALDILQACSTHKIKDADKRKLSALRATASNAAKRFNDAHEESTLDSVAFLNEAEKHLRAHRIEMKRVHDARKRQQVRFED